MADILKRILAVKAEEVEKAKRILSAAAGGRVAKHGNRAVSSKSGSADVLEALGANINLKPEQVGRCIDEVGWASCSRRPITRR